MSTHMLEMSPWNKGLGSQAKRKSDDSTVIQAMTYSTVIQAMVYSTVKWPVVDAMRPLILAMVYSTVIQAMMYSTVIQAMVYSTAKWPLLSLLTYAKHNIIISANKRV